MTSSFWAARPVLEHLLAVARARRVGPWAVLGNAMARAVASIPPNVTLPGQVGGRTSLNLFVASVGSSGSGKGGADAASASGLKFVGSSLPIVQVPLGSGEGAARTFRPVGTPLNAKNPVTSAVFTCPEIDTLTALMSRQGSTLSAELRKLYSGEQLGFANAAKDTRNVVEAGSYRACLIAGVQPLRSHTLLNASDGGLPQRFVWLPTSDIDAPDEPPTDPGTRMVKVPAWNRIATKRLHLVDEDIDLEVPEIARNTIDAHRLLVLRQDPAVDPLDGHALLCQLKVAVALMVLDGRSSVSDEDWELADVILAVSARTREHCRIAINDRFRKKNTARALAAAEHDEIVSERKAQRARDGVLRRLTAHDEQTRAELCRALKVDIRGYLDHALAVLVDSGEIHSAPAKRGTQDVHVYSRSTPQKSPPNCGVDPWTEGTRVLEPDQAPQARTGTPTHDDPNQDGATKHPLPPPCKAV